MLLSIENIGGKLLYNSSVRGRSENVMQVVMIYYKVILCRTPAYRI